MNTQLKGRDGEARAAEYLMKKGYKLIGANYHSRYGEIDLIVSKKEIIAFVEVKLRKNNAYAGACEAVTPAKQHKIMLTAQLWAAENNCKNPLRFDIIEIYTDTGLINHMENAFS